MFFKTILYILLLQFILFWFFGSFLGRKSIYLYIYINVINFLLINFFLDISFIEELDLGIMFYMYLRFDWAFIFKFFFFSLSIIFMVITLGIVHIYSINYLANDIFIIMFLLYLRFLVIFEFLTICLNNFTLFCFSWELIWLIFYLLISFWDYSQQWKISISNFIYFPFNNIIFYLGNNYKKYNSFRLLGIIFSWLERTDYEYFSNSALKTYVCWQKVMITYMDDDAESPSQNVICDPTYVLTSYKGQFIGDILVQYWSWIDWFNQYWYSKKPYLDILICTKIELSLKLHSEWFAHVWENNATSLVYKDPLDLLLFIYNKEWRVWDTNKTIVILQPSKLDTLDGLQYLSKLAQFLKFLEENPNFNWDEIDVFVKEIFIQSLNYL